MIPLAGMTLFQACTSECVPLILGLMHHSRFIEEDQHHGSDMVVGKYIPNLVPKSFDVLREYAQIIYIVPTLQQRVVL
jgi:hypothetical protein